MTVLTIAGLTCKESASQDTLFPLTHHVTPLLLKEHYMWSASKIQELPGPSVQFTYLRETQQFPQHHYLHEKISGTRENCHVSNRKVNYILFAQPADHEPTRILREIVLKLLQVVQSPIVSISAHSSFFFCSFFPGCRR